MRYTHICHPLYLDRPCDLTLSRYLEYNSDGHFEAATGTLREETTDGLLEFKAHMWIECTLDGGAAPFISYINGSQLRRYLQELSAGKEAPFDWRYSQSIPKAPKRGITYAHCHCKGVEFYISPPNEASKLAASDWPDLIIPNEAGASKNITNYPWWLPTQDRYLAGTCTCRTCTRASGFDITFWAFVPVVNITLDAEGKKPFTRNSYWGSMRSYRSKEDVTRSFCGGCGANIFYDGHSRPSLVDVAVGLIDEPSGARAEELLAWWTDRVSFKEFALNKALVEGLEEGLKEWGRNNKGSSFVAKMHVP